MYLAKDVPLYKLVLPDFNVIPVHVISLNDIIFYTVTGPHHSTS